ncbi:MAG: hypothetical protein ACTSPG_06375 [Candidatus Hodarchaeales archaeon]
MARKKELGKLITSVTTYRKYRAIKKCISIRAYDLDVLYKVKKVLQLFGCTRVCCELVMSI